MYIKYPYLIAVDTEEEYFETKLPKHLKSKDLIYHSEVLLKRNVKENMTGRQASITKYNTREVCIHYQQFKGFFQSMCAKYA